LAAPLGPLFDDGGAQTLALLLIEYPVLVGVETLRDLDRDLDRGWFLLSISRSGEQGQRQKADG